MKKYFEYYQSLHRDCFRSLLKSHSGKAAPKLILTAIDEAFIKYFESVPEYVANDKNKTFKWLLTTANNLIKDSMRKERNYRKRNTELERLNQQTGEYSAEWIDEIYNETIEDKIYFKIAFEEALTLLTERQKLIIRMEREGFTNFEIAQSLGISERTVNIEKKKYYKIIREKCTNPLSEN